ncbi:PRC-barrel domain-containing protein [Maricaulis sp. CAU 1757]
MKRILIATTSLFAASTAYAQEGDVDPTVHGDDMHIETQVEADLDLNHERDWAETTAHAAFTEDHELVDASVYGVDGEEIGEVEMVRLSASGEVDAIVVEKEGLLDLGESERLLEMEDFTVDRGDDAVMIRTTLSSEQFEALPEFDDDRVALDQVDDESDRYDVAEIDDDDLSLDDDDWETPYTDHHELVEADVFGSDGSELGEVERVRLSSSGEVEAVVVEYGGILEVGGREILVEAGAYTTEMIDDDLRLTLTYDQAGFEALPDFNEREATTYPFSDDDIGNDNADEEGEPDLGDGSR